MSDNLDEKVKSFIAVAESYCRLIECFSSDEPTSFLRKIQLGLAELKIAFLKLPPTEFVDGEDTPDRSMEDRHALKDKMINFLGPRDAYWTIYDSQKLGEAGVVETLSDDLTDIYWDVRDALEILSTGSDVNGALWAIQFTFVSHWGRHVASAEKAIHDQLSEHYFDILSEEGKE